MRLSLDAVVVSTAESGSSGASQLNYKPGWHIFFMLMSGGRDAFQERQKTDIYIA